MSRASKPHEWWMLHEDEIPCSGSDVRLADGRFARILEPRGPGTYRAQLYGLDNRLTPEVVFISDQHVTVVTPLET